MILSRQILLALLAGTASAMKPVSRLRRSRHRRRLPRVPGKPGRGGYDIFSSGRLARRGPKLNPTYPETAFIRSLKQDMRRVGTPKQFLVSLRDPKRYFEVIESKRVTKAKKLEADFQHLVHGLPEYTEREMDTQLYEQNWELRSESGNADEKEYKRTLDSIRVVQFNVLAHGLSDNSAGFAPMFKPGTPHFFRIEEGSDREKTYLEGEEYLEVLLASQKRRYHQELPPRLKRALGLVVKQNPDVICMQENGPDGVAIFWDSTRFEKLGDPVKKRLHKAGRRPSGGVSSNPEDFAKQVILSVTLRDRHTNKSFVVVSGHLKSGKKKGDIADKMSHAEEVAQILSKYDFPVIFAADMNTSHETESYKKFHNAVSSSMAPAYDLAKNRREGRCSAVKLRLGGAQPDKIGERIRQTIDFIYRSNAFEVKSTLSIPCADDILTAEDRLSGSRGNGYVCYAEREAHFVLTKEEYTEKGKTKFRYTEKPGARPYTPTGDEAKKLGLPNWKYPSDHFMKGADLVLI